MKGSEATKAWHIENTDLKETGLQPQAAKAQTGLPHIHVWNALVKVLLELLTAAKQEAQTNHVKTYLDGLIKLGQTGAMDRLEEVEFIRISRMYERE